MGTITDHLATAFRDFVTAGVPSSGNHWPTKADARALGPVIETAMASIGMGALVDVTKATRALLDADLAHAVNTVALVYADATDANNDLYIKVGASGAGSWTLTTVLHDIVEALTQPALDAVAAAAAEAANLKAARLKTDLLAVCGSAARISCLLTKDGAITYKAGTTVNEIDEIRPLLPETGLKFGQHGVTWDGNGSPIAALAVRPVPTATGLRFTREVNLTAKTDAGALTTAMPALSGKFSIAAVIRTPAIFFYADAAAMNADLANRRVGDIGYANGAADPTAGGAYDPIPTDCILSCDTGVVDSYWTGGFHVRGNAAWARATGQVAALFAWWEAANPTTKFARISADAAGRILFYGYDGAAQIENLTTWGATANYWQLAAAGPVMIQVEKDEDETVLYVNGKEYATYHTPLSFTPDRFNINGGPGTPSNATVPISSTSFDLDALLILNGCSYRQVLEAGNVLARAFGTPERAWSDNAYLAVWTDQSRFASAVGGNASNVSSTPSIPDPVSNWAFILGQRTNTDFAISFPSRECIPGVFAAESLTNSHRLGPIRCTGNIFGILGSGGSRTMNGSGNESVEWGFSREVQRNPLLASSHLYHVGATYGGYAEEALRAENAAYLFGLLSGEIAVNVSSQPRSAVNRAILNVARRVRKRGQRLLPLFVGNFQGETQTFVSGAAPIEGKTREDDLRNWWSNQIAKLASSDTPPPVLAAKTIMFSGDGTSNSYNTEAFYTKDGQYLSRESNQDKDFRFILLGGTGNWMGRGIHWEAVFQRRYGAIIGDRVRRAYCDGQLTGATKITSATVGTAGNAGKIVLNVNRRLAIDAGGNPMMPGTYKTGGLNGAGFLSYGLIFESHATGTVTFSGVPADGDTVTVGAQVYTFREYPRAAYEVKIADTAALCARNLLYAVQGDGTAYTNHGAATLASTVAFGTISGAVVRLYALAVGTAGNTVALAESSAAIAVSGATLAGADDTRAIGGDVTLTNLARTAQIFVPISGAGPKIGDVIRVTGSGVLFSNFREETVRTGYYPTQAWPALPLADSSPTLDYSAAASLSDYLAPQRAPVTA